jgi:hypothetical protein
VIRLRSAHKTLQWDEGSDPSEPPFAESASDPLTQGTLDPNVLADLPRGGLRRKLPALRQALAGPSLDELPSLPVTQPSATARAACSARRSAPRHFSRSRASASA